MFHVRRKLIALSLAAGVSGVFAQGTAPDLAPMPEPKPGNAAMVELGKYFFFDNRLSGDWGVSCASCHDPEKGWGDGQALSVGYPSMEYFRNSPTVLNAAHRKQVRHTRAGYVSLASQRQLEIKLTSKLAEKR